MLTAGLIQLPSMQLQFSTKETENLTYLCIVFIILFVCLFVATPGHAQGLLLSLYLGITSCGAQGFQRSNLGRPYLLYYSSSQNSPEFQTKVLRQSQKSIIN